MKKEVLFLLAIVFLIPLILAVPPVTQVQQFANGFVVQVPQDNILKLNETYDFEFHVYNISNGGLVENGLSCIFHLYNYTGRHQLSKTVTNSVEGDYSFIIEGSNFSGLGSGYYYNIFCNSTLLSGYNSVNLLITPTGEEQSVSQAVGSLSYLFLMLALTIMFGWMGFKLSESDKLWVLGIFFLFFSVLFIIYDTWLGYEYHRNYTGSLSSGMPEIIFYILLFILVVGFIVSLALLFTKWDRIVKWFKTGISKGEQDYEEDEIDRSFND